MNRYEVGQTIEAREYGRREWRRACVVSLAPYRGQPGYYIQWLDRPYSEEEQRAHNLPQPSSGGWIMENSMRPIL